MAGEVVPISDIPDNIVPASDLPSTKQRPWWKRPGYELIPESVRTGMAEAVRSAINSPITQGALNSPYADVAAFPFKAADLLINKPIDYLVANPLGKLTGKAATAMASYSLPRLLGMEQGTPQGDISAGQDIGQGVRGAINVGAPFAFGPSVISSIRNLPSNLISGIKRVTGTYPNVSKVVTTAADEIAAANAESQYLYRTTIEARQKSVEAIQQRIEQAKITERSTKAATLADLDAALETAKATEPMALKAAGEDVLAQIKSRAPGLPAAKQIANKAATESLTPTEVGLAIKGPEYQVDLNNPQGLYWQRMEEARAPLRQAYRDIKKAAQQVKTHPSQTLGAYEVMLADAGLAGEAFPTAGERAAESLAGAIAKPVPTMRAVGESQKGRLFAKSDMLAEEDQGAKIADAIIAKAKSGPGESAHMPASMFNDLLKGVVDNPEVSVADLIGARQRLRGAQRVVKDEVVKHQLGQLEIAVTADMTTASSEITSAQSLLDKQYFQKIVPYYVKGAVPRNIIDNKAHGAILNSVIGSPVSHDAEGIIAFKEMINDPVKFKQLITRPYIDEQIRLSFDKITGNWDTTAFVKRLIGLSPEKKNALFGDLTPLTDQLIENIQRANRVTPVIEKQITSLAKQTGPEVGQIQEQLRAARQTTGLDWGRVSKTITNLEEQTRPDVGLLTMPEQSTVGKSLSEKMQSKLEHVSSFAGPWMILHGIFSGNMARVTEGAGVALAGPMISKLMSSEAGLKLLNAGTTIARTTKNATLFAAKANAILNPLQNADAPMSDKIRIAIDRLNQ